MPREHGCDIGEDADERKVQLAANAQSALAVLAAQNAARHKISRADERDFGSVRAKNIKFVSGRADGSFSSLQTEKIPSMISRVICGSLVWLSMVEDDVCI